MVYITHLWWLGGWFIIAIPTLTITAKHQPVFLCCWPRPGAANLRCRSPPRSPRRISWFLQWPTAPGTAQRGRGSCTLDSKKKCQKMCHVTFKTHQTWWQIINLTYINDDLSYHLISCLETHLGSPYLTMLQQIFFSGPGFSGFTGITKRQQKIAAELKWTKDLVN